VLTERNRNSQAGRDASIKINKRNQKLSSFTNARLFSERYQTNKKSNQISVYREHQAARFLPPGVYLNKAKIVKN